jgi:alpha-galactosidase
LQNDEWAVAFLNRSVLPKSIDFNWSNEVITDTLAKRTFNTAANPFKLRDCYLKKEVGNTKKPLRSTLPAHDILLLRLIKQP